MSIRIRTSHVIVIAISTLALVFGVGAAGAVAGQKWINGHDIKPNSLPANRIQKNSVSGKQIKARTITKRALTADTLDDLQQTVVYVDNLVTAADADSDGNVAVTCPTDTQVVAGYVKPGGTGLVSFGNSYIDPAQNALIVQFTIPGNVTVQTICLR